MSESDEKTMIPVSKSIRLRIQQLGHKGETYDDILNRLMDNNVKLEKELAFCRDWMVDEGIDGKYQEVRGQNAERLPKGMMLQWK